MLEGIHGEVHLWCYVEEALFWINIALGGSSRTLLVNVCIFQYQQYL